MSDSPLIAEALDAYASALRRIEEGRRLVAEGRAARDMAAGALVLDAGLDPVDARRLLRVGLDQMERMVNETRWWRAAKAEQERVAAIEAKVTCLRCATVIPTAAMEEHDRLHASAAGGEPEGRLPS